MLAKKRRIYLADSQYIFGIGVKVMVKYFVTQLPNDKGFKLSVVGDKKKRKSFFKTDKEYFIEGNTLYSHGLRLFPYSKKRDKQWLAMFNKAKLYEKLELLSKIASQLKNASEQKINSISGVIDETFRNMATHDKGIRNSVKKYFE